LPFPTRLADESAAASVTRTHSIVKLLSIMLIPYTYVLINCFVIESFLFQSILHGVFLHQVLPISLLYFHIRVRYVQFHKFLFGLQPLTRSEERRVGTGSYDLKRRGLCSIKMSQCH